MFSFLQSPEKKARTQARHWLELGTHVWNVRRDVLAPADAAELDRSRRELARKVGERARPVDIESSVKALEKVLTRTGGTLFPRRVLPENVEFFLVATLVILGFRTYFIQPMVIPTNSMWPTYYGLTGENFPPGTQAPGPIARLFRLVAFGAVREELDAPVSGEVYLPVGVNDDDQPRVGLDGQPILVHDRVMGRKWLVIPDKQSEYTLFVGDTPASIRLPEDFDTDFRGLLTKQFFPPGHSFADQWSRAMLEKRIRKVGEHIDLLPLDLTVNPGDPIVRFDLMRGDMVFVDRMSYHFVRPRVGSAFVFFTGNIPSIGNLGIPEEYIIKRLTGEAGDTLRIDPPVLYRNGAPIQGANAFEENARRGGLYRGYLNPPAGQGMYLLPGQTVTVPPRSFMGIGDNSEISDDGRYWGFVPEKEVIGRPLFVYYPFTRRWGLAR